MVYDQWSAHWAVVGETSAMGSGLKEKFKITDGWSHHLYALPDESHPDGNHIHVKSRDGEWVLCSIKVDGMHVINRRKLIDRINNLTGLNLQYR